MTDTTDEGPMIDKLLDDELKPARYVASMLDRVEALSRPSEKVPELFFHVPKQEQWNIDIGESGEMTAICPRCESGEVMNALPNVLECQTCGHRELDHDTPLRRASVPIHTSPFEPPEYGSSGSVMSNDEDDDES